MSEPTPHLFGFTSKYNGIAWSIVTPVDVDIPFDPTQLGGAPEPTWYSVRGIWDTGATNSVITSKVIQARDLKPIGIVEVGTPNGKSNANTYLVNFRMPNHVGFVGIRVTEGKLEDVDVLVGMDIINKGDMSITNKDGQTWMTYQIPATHRTDFVDEITPMRTIQQKLQEGKIGRNDPCPCGSGKKYKRCHGLTA
jgi:hypothetical protein